MAVPPTISGIELFSGVGMLGEGLRAGLGHLGVSYRTVCHVEREAHAAAVLAARMEEGSLDAAPVWSDVCTFDAAAWHGRVDCVVAGFPCQDLSIAGRRAGLDGKRSGLFFEVCRIAHDCGAWLLVLENVAGIATATASVVDQAEGELDERAASRVVGELADLGWDAEWITLSASDVGASHGRARWFCIAWRLGNAGLQHEHLQQRGLRAEHPGAGHAMDDAERAERRPQGAGVAGECQGDDRGRPEADGGPGVAVAVLADPGRWDVRGLEPQPVGRRGDQAGDLAGGAAVADASAPGWRPAQGCDEPGQRCVEEQGGAGGGECGRDAVGRPEVVGERVADPSLQRQPITAGGGMPDRMKNRTASPSLSQTVTHSPSLPQALPTPDGPPSSPSTPNSPRHLNPLFAAWLMGWPTTWVIAEPHASSASATALWRCRLQQQLSCLLGAVDSSV